MSSFGGQIATVLFGRSVIRVMQLAIFVILARLLTPTEFGWFGLIVTSFALASMLGTFGLRQSLAQRIGRDEVDGGQSIAIILACWPFLTGISAAVIIFLYGRQIPELGWVGAGILLTAGAAGYILVSLLQGIYLGRGAIRTFSISEALVPMLLLIFLAILMAGADSSLTAALWSQVSAAVLSLPVLLYLAVKNSQEKLRLPYRLIPGMFRDGIIFAFNLFAILLCARLSMYVVEAFHGAAAAGAFFAAVRISDIFLEVAAAAGMVLFSNAVRRSGEERDAVIVHALRTASTMFWTFFVLAGFVVLAAPVIVPLTLGPGYGDAVPALQILALSLPPLAATKTIYPAIAGSGNPLFGTPLIVMSLAVNGALALLLVPRFGTSGGAIALVVGQYMLFAGYVLACRRRFAVTLSVFDPRTPMPTLAASLSTLTRRLSAKVRRDQSTGSIPATSPPRADPAGLPSQLTAADSIAPVRPNQ